MNLITKKFEPRNRDERRKIESEFMSIPVSLLNIEFLFCEDVLTSEFNSISYIEIYNFHLCQFRRWCGYTKKLSLKYLEINDNYFEQMFKPIEKEN